MKNVRKSFLIALSLVLVLVVAACSGKNKVGNEVQGEVKKNDPVTLRVGILDTPAEKENMEAVVEVFKKDYPNVNITYEPITGDAKQKLLAQASAGTMPDVVWVYDGAVKAFAEGSVLEPLDDYLKGDKVDISDIYPGMLGLGQVEGKTYMIPRDHNQIVLFVNKTLLEQEGLAMPENGWKWETFVEYAKKLTKKDASGKTTQFGVVLEPKWDPVWVSFALGRGGSFLDEKTMKVSFSDPKVVQGLKDGWDLVKEGIATDPNVQYPENMFNAGKAAFRLHVKPVATEINDAAKANGFEWDVVSFPALPGRHAVGGGTSGYAVNAKSNHKAEAAALVSLFVTPEGQKAFGKTGNSVPVLKSMVNDSVWRENPAPGKNADAYVSFPEAGVLRLHEVVLPVAAAAEVSAGVQLAFDKYVTDKSSLEESLKELDQKVNAIIEKK